MLFGEYLKLCRSTTGLTQEELARKLYIFDDIFISIEANTISRWERCIVSPTYKKQIKLIKFFQQYSAYIIPCFENINNISPEQTTYIIGKTKDIIQSLPIDVFSPKDIILQKVTLNQDIQKSLKMSFYIFEKLSHGYFHITLKQFKEWSQYPSSHFTIATINHNFCGAFFIIKLKPDIYKKIIYLEAKLQDLKYNDFASPEEEGCEFLLNFYAYHQSIAQMLFADYYIHLIHNQLLIKEIGTTPTLKSVISLLKKMNLKHITSKRELKSYSSSLEDVLLNKNALKVIFKQTI